MTYIRCADCGCLPEEGEEFDSESEESHSEESESKEEQEKELP